MATRSTKRSRVWDYFEYQSKDGGISDKDVIICMLCATPFKHQTGTTSSMTAHLKRKHGINLDESNRKRKLTKQQETQSSLSWGCAQSPKLETTSTTAVGTPGSGQLLISHVLAKKNQTLIFLC